ncbi:MAG: hypothetical protein A3C06_03475 [Candidatus Taylorbacteria bacterium RIFCSPHIGHO2_02_FULL_46_13]|uniref:Uncharacterized protein n=1 Tax=Candidatus Taylorbacteria bacterium RIFCSPHIGHO2_02_FULL_46_13 TaxID=1802312 RepID=A0A1G2MUG4_9BACT|nr:MAG: hypothetical protein A3C06_03475 [Candidatus Taylorbacteria bacterium RIFCSPHIGHO2_02_FULL_46_13]
MKTELLDDLSFVVLELLSLLDKATFDTFEPLVYQGTPFLFFYFYKLDEDHTPVWLSTSTHVHGYDIYVWRLTPKEMKRRYLFHELLEVHLRNKGQDNKGAHL